MDAIPQEPNFRLSNDAAEILSVLQENDLTWIAQELESVILRGRLITKEYQEEGKRKRKKGRSTVPFTDAEQLRIVLEALDNYFVVSQEMWEKARYGLGDSLGMPIVSFSIVDTTGQPIVVFFDEARRHGHALRELIKEALQEEGLDQRSH